MDEAVALEDEIPCRIDKACCPREGVRIDLLRQDPAGDEVLLCRILGDEKAPLRELPGARLSLQGDERPLEPAAPSLSCRQSPLQDRLIRIADGLAIRLIPAPEHGPLKSLLLCILEIQPGIEERGLIEIVPILEEVPEDRQLRSHAGVQGKALPCVFDRKAQVLPVIDDQVRIILVPEPDDVVLIQVRLLCTRNAGAGSKRTGIDKVGRQVRAKVPVHGSLRDEKGRIGIPVQDIARPS